MNEEKIKHDFIIGDQYDKYEFLVESMNIFQDNGLEVEMCRYSGVLQAINGYKLQNIWLLFNGDILILVIYQLEDTCSTEYRKEVIKDITSFYGQNFIVKGETTTHLLNRILNAIIE